MPTSALSPQQLVASQIFEEERARLEFERRRAAEQQEEETANDETKDELLLGFEWAGSALLKSIAFGTAGVGFVVTGLFEIALFVYQLARYGVSRLVARGTLSRSDTIAQMLPPLRWPKPLRLLPESLLAINLGIKGLIILVLLLIAGGLIFLLVAVTMAMTNGGPALLFSYFTDATTRNMVNQLLPNAFSFIVP